MSWTFPARLLPDNERTNEILQKEKEEEELRKAKIEEMRQVREREEKSKRAKAASADAEKARKERMAKDFADKQKEALEEATKIDGKMQGMFYNL